MSVSFSADTIFEAGSRNKRCFARRSPLYAPGRYRCPEDDGWENTSWYKDYMYVLERLNIRAVFTAAVNDESSAFQEALKMAKEYATPGASWPARTGVQVRHSAFFAQIWAQAAKDASRIGSDEIITSLYKARILEADSVIILVSQNTGKFLTFMPIVPDHHDAFLKYVIKLRQDIPFQNRGKHRQKRLCELGKLEGPSDASQEVLSPIPKETFALVQDEM